MTTTHSDMTVRCQYCDDCSHLTVECPGLQSSSPIAREFKERHFGAPKCYWCKQPSHAARKLFTVSKDDPSLICGDCLSGGTPLTEQPVREPERINYHAGMTPTWDWVGDT